MMERLTNKREAAQQRKNYEKRLEQGYPRNIPEERFLKLAYYEDMEEQGRPMLPCKPGDKVYRIVRWGKNNVSIRERIIYSVEYLGDGDWVIHSTGDDVLGKKCFLTREEAEQALKGGAGK